MLYNFYIYIFFTSFLVVHIYQQMAGVLSFHLGMTLTLLTYYFNFVNLQFMKYIFI
jgi:hypothetical protein